MCGGTGPGSYTFNLPIPLSNLQNNDTVICDGIDFLNSQGVSNPQFDEFTSGSTDANFISSRFKSVNSNKIGKYNNIITLGGNPVNSFTQDNTTSTIPYLNRLVIINDDNKPNYINVPTTSIQRSNWNTTICDDVIKHIIIGCDVTQFINDGTTGTFSNTSNLETVILPNTLCDIAPYTFEQSGLLEITIPGSVDTIGGRAFYNDTKLKELTICDGVGDIGSNAFEECTALPSVTIPGSVKTIGAFAFYQCCDLTDLTICDGVCDIGLGAFFDCAALPSVTIPGSVQTIGEFAFYQCNDLTNLTICDGVCDIGVSAFHNCSALLSVTIPGSVKTIENQAFQLCSDLTKLA